MKWTWGKREGAGGKTIRSSVLKPSPTFYFSLLRHFLGGAVKKMMLTWSLSGWAPCWSPLSLNCWRDRVRSEGGEGAAAGVAKVYFIFSFLISKKYLYIKYTLYFRFLFQRNVMHSGVNLLFWDTVKVTQFVLIVHVGMTQVIQNISLEIRRVFCGRLITIKCYL